MPGDAFTDAGPGAMTPPSRDEVGNTHPSYGSRTMRTHIIPLTIVCCFVSAALADDLHPPPWERYTADTGFAHWTFAAEDANDPIWPDSGSYPDPIPLLNANQDWYAMYDGRSGVANAGESTYLLLPGEMEPLDIYVQFVAHADAPVESLSAAGYEKRYGYTVELLDEFQFAGTGWWYHRYHVTAHFLEFAYGLALHAENDTMLLDQLVVDWTPEPGGMLALTVLLGCWPRRQ